MARLATNAKNDEDVVFVVFYDKDKNEEVMGSGRQKIRPDISEPDFFVRITDRDRITGTSMISKVKGKTEVSRQPPGYHPAALFVALLPSQSF